MMTAKMEFKMRDITKRLIPIKLILLLIPTLLIVGCSKDNEENDYLPVEGDIIFTVGESYLDLQESSEPQPAINLTTSKIYGHTGYEIISNVMVSGNSVSVNIDGIKELVGGFTMMTASSRSLFFDIDPGFYELTFYCRGYSQSSYTLQVAESYFEIEALSVDNLVTTMERRGRLPHNTLAIVGTTIPEETGYVSDFADLVLGLAGVAELSEFAEFPWPHRYYSHDSTEVTTQIDINYNDDANYSLIETMFEEYCSALNYFGGDIKVYDWKNRQLYSSTFVSD